MIDDDNDNELTAENLRWPEQVSTGQSKTQRRDKVRAKTQLPDWFPPTETYWPYMPDSAMQVFCQLPGKGNLVGQLCYRQYKTQQSLEFKLKIKLLRDLGVGRTATYGALKEMRARGLLTYRSRQGAYPVITLIPPGNLTDKCSQDGEGCTLGGSATRVYED